MEKMLYTRAFPEFGSRVPELLNATCTCYYSYASEREELDNPGCCEKFCWRPCAIMSRSPESGLLLLEDLTKIPKKPYAHLAKFKVPSLEHVKMAVTGLC